MLTVQGRSLAGLLCFGLLAGAAVGHAQATDDTRPETALVYTNDDLPPALPSGTPPATGRADDRSAEHRAAVVTYANYRDRNGHDRAWWRSRVFDLEWEIRVAEAVRDHAYWRMQVQAEGNPYPDTREYEDAEARLEQLEGRRALLVEEARRAGALPGWVRDLVRE